MKIFILIIVVAVVALGIYYISQSKNSVIQTNESPASSVSQTPDFMDELLSQDSVSVIMKTTRGDIELELYPKVAPKTVANFLKLSGEDFYDGTKFHRVVEGFVIQGGDPFSRTDDPRVGTGDPGYKFEDEINPAVLGLREDVIAQLEERGYRYNYELESLPVDVGVIAMANSGPNTNGSQFFIVTTTPQPHLNGLHTVFGRVTKGMDVVLAIKQGDIVETIEIK